MARADRPTQERPELTGQLTALRPILPEDLAAMAEWDRDPEIVALMGQKFGTAETLQEWYERTQSDRSCRALSIVTREGRLIGEVELDRIDWRAGTAELRICIGDKAYWGRGYGYDALQSFLRLALGRWGLRTVYLRVYQANQRAVRLYQRLGFAVQGVLAPSRRRGDSSEVWLMAVSREQFERAMGRAVSAGA